MENNANNHYKPQHPLPEEIENMKRDDTVCQFCGVSYLIHNEIKKLENKLEEYKKEVYISLIPTDLYISSFFIYLSLFICYRLKD